MKKYEETLQDLWDSTKKKKKRWWGGRNINTMGIPEGKEKEKGKESISKTKIAQNFPNLEREMGTQIHVPHRTFKMLSP